MLETLEARMKLISTELEKSAANHNSLIGAMNELKALYDLATQEAPIIEGVVEAVEAVV